MLAKSHSNPSKKDRKSGRAFFGTGVPTLTRMYNKSDDVVTKVYSDIANGVSRSDCLEKLQLGAYENKPVKARQAAVYYNAALDRFAVDTDIEAKKLRDIFFARYESILEQCIKNGDMYNARATLDSMSRIFGVEQKMPTTAIQVNNNSDGVTINFGFNNENNGNNVVDAEYDDVSED